MDRYLRMKKSREAWKSKAVERATDVRELNKDKNRQKLKIQEMQDHIVDLQSQLDDSAKKNAKFQPS